MNMNQVINMIIRQVMNRLIRSGVNTGMNAGSNMLKGRKKPAPHGQIDDYGNPVDRDPRR